MMPSPGRQPHSTTCSTEDPGRGAARSDMGRDQLEQTYDRLMHRGPTLTAKAFVHRPDRLSGRARVGCVGSSGEYVHDRGDVLAAQDLLSVKVGRRRPHLPVDDRERITQPRQLLTSA